MARSPESLEGRNSANICPNGTSEESIGIYSKSRCPWSGRLIKTELGQGEWPSEPAGALGTTAATKAPRGSGGLCWI